MRDKIIELLGQTIAPRLYQLCGKKPEEMGFPIYDTREEVEAHIQRQFDPVGYWLDKGREMAEDIVSVIEAGGVVFADGGGSLDAMLKAAAKGRR